MNGDVAKVHIIDIPYFADKLYDYYIPTELSSRVEVGSLVSVPFGGGNKRMSAIVRAVASESEYEQLKPVLSVSGGEPLLDGEQIAMCDFLKSYTLCTFGDAARTVVPAAAFSKVTEYLETDPSKQFDASSVKLPERSVALYAYLSEHGKCPTSAVTAKFGEDTSKYVLPLIKAKYVLRSGEVKESSNIKTENYISPALSREELSDISQSRSSEEGITDRMQKHVRIGMAKKAKLMGNLHAADDQLAAFYQPMYIISTSNSHKNPLSVIIFL